MSLLYQLDTSVIGTMFSDTGKTTQITNGGTCAAWTAPNGLITTDAVQSTSANRPTYRSNYSSSGYSGLEFDDSNDQMSIAHSSGWNLTIIDMFIVLTSTSLAVGTYKGIVTKFGDVWASSNKTTADQIVKRINQSVKDNKGKGYLFLTKVVFLVFT